MGVGCGKLTPSGTDACPGVVFEPDPSAWAGKSPFVVFFSVPSRTLHAKDTDETAVALSLSSTPKSTPKFGLKHDASIKIFTTPLMNRSQVFVVPDEPRGLDESLGKIFANDGHQEDSVSVTTDPRAAVLPLSLPEPTSQTLRPKTSCQVVRRSRCVKCPHVSWRLVAVIRDSPRVELLGDEIVACKRPLPVLAERCRTWKLVQNCKFLAKKSVPLSLERRGPWEGRLSAALRKKGSGSLRRCPLLVLPSA